MRNSFIRTDADEVTCMHWSDDSFGCFPSYLLGSIYDGMFLEAAEKEFGSIDTLLAEGKIRAITEWLNTSIHQYGSLRLPGEVIRTFFRRKREGGSKCSALTFYSDAANCCQPIF